MSEYDVIVVGGGAAGMFSAGTAAASGLRVLLLEKNRELGKKLRITGKGRCNVTNAAPPEEVFRNVIRGSRFLYSSVGRFPPDQVMAFFEGLGVPLKTERGNRVFPVSDRAQDVVDALSRWIRAQGVTVRQATVDALLIEDGTLGGVRAGSREHRAKCVILATGGLSYPATGSTGDGYILARQAGHSIVPCSGSLVPLEVEGGCRTLAGLSLRNTGLTLWGSKKKPLYRDFGELLFMHYGLSGPTVLSASCHVEEDGGPYTIELDLKPALDQGKLDARILRDFRERRNDAVCQGIRPLLPGPLVPLVLDRAGVPRDTPVHDVTREQRRAIVTTVKRLRLPVTGKRPVAEAIVTRGGVKLSEVDPKTMESRLLPGLHFAGELLDLDAYTGGFNLQIAWSTARAAGAACAEQYTLSEKIEKTIDK